jgi:Zn-dependent protease
MGAPIGWAKPVPVNPARFHRGVRMSTGDALVSVAGPFSNILLGLVAAVIFGVLLRLAPEVVSPGAAGRAMLIRFMLVNAGLAIFNLLPIPPLDGGGVAAWFVPERLRGAWETFSRFGPLVLIALILLPQSPLSSLIYGPANLLLGALHRLALAS